MLVRLFRIVAPPVRVTFQALRWMVLPAVLLVALSLASGLVRTTALGAFAVIVLLKGLMLFVVSTWATASPPRACCRRWRDDHRQERLPDPDRRPRTAGPAARRRPR
ncbi:hypothetical protein [Saccharopolyspora gregorii]|uniref:Uncharacterized protein n=1 Tax=Saccharopolyspora gregorii TaxID=33914 RepID=A0ABP6RHW4_9PSEU